MIKANSNVYTIWIYNQWIYNLDNLNKQEQKGRKILLHKMQKKYIEWNKSYFLYFDWWELMQSQYSQHYHVVGWRLRSFLSENFLISPFCISKKSFSGVKTEGECNQPNQKGRLIWQENLRLSDVICLVVLNFIFGNIFFYFDSAEGTNFEIFIYKHFLTLINKSIFITLLLFIRYLLKTNKKR